MEINPNGIEEMLENHDTHNPEENESCNTSNIKSETIELKTPYEIKTHEDLEEICQTNDNRKNYIISSAIPELCKVEKCILGIDEAGRGPVLGPMVYGICYCPKIKEEDLKEIGCMDSKALTEEKREVLFDKLCASHDYVGWRVEVISPLTISKNMLKRQKVTLNEISHGSAIGLIKQMQDAGANIAEVFVDTVGPAEKYQAKLQAIFPEIVVTVANKADSKFPIVSAASICAKVTRDIALKVWKFPEYPDRTDIVMGSGYPNDPDTKKFLEDYIDPIFGFPQLVRFSWSTAQKVLESKALPMEWDDEDETTSNIPSIRSFFKQTNGTARRQKHTFFTERHLISTVDF